MACTKAHRSSCFPSRFKDLAPVLYLPAVCPQGYTPGDIIADTELTGRTSCVCCPARVFDSKSPVALGGLLYWYANRTRRDMTFNLDATNCQGLVTGATNVVVDNTTARHSSFLGIAPLMLIAWESSDLASLTPPSAPLLQIAAKATSPGSTSANESTTYVTGVNTDAAALPAGGLAKEAKIGIGVGTACGVLLVCTFVGILIYRRRLRRSREKTGDVRQAGETGGVGIVAKAELGGESHVVEIDSREGVAETDGTSARHKLEGNRHGYEVRGT